MSTEPSINKASNSTLLMDGLLHVGVGSLFSGVIGGGLAAYNAGQPQGGQLKAPPVITPGEKERAIAEQVVGHVKGAAMDTITSPTGLPTNLKGLNKTLGMG